MTDSVLSQLRTSLRDTSRRDLYMAVGESDLDVMIYNTLEDNSLITASLALDPAKSLEGRLRDAIYDNPVLLSDFRKVSMIVREPSTSIMPTAATEGGSYKELAALMPGDTGGILCHDQLPRLDASVVYRLDRDAFHFMQRTFRSINIVHSLSVLTRFTHGTQGVSGSDATHVYLSPGFVHIIIYRGDNLMHAQRYKASTTEDIAYYITACREIHGTESQHPVIVAAPRERLKSALDELRAIFPNVVPAVFPSAMFRAGGDTAMNTPTDLIVMPLCE